jgi:dTDP-glucose 4,6-dehydratase
VPRMLVTGGAGFIGANYVHYWLNTHPGDRIVVLDALTYAGNLASLEPVLARPELRFVLGSICDTDLVEKLLANERLDTIVHFAAESHVDRSISGPDAFIESNVVGTHSLLKAARKVWLQGNGTSTHRFHHISTDEVYGSLGLKDAAFTEDTPYAPNSPYSASKAGSDHLVRAYHRTYGLKTTISNCSNNFGPYQFPEKLIPLMILNALHGLQLPVYGDGMNIRDWLFVEDHCRAIDSILRRGRDGRTYNIGGKYECTNRQVVGTVCSVLNRQFELNPQLADTYPECPASRGCRCDSLIRFVPDRPGHDRRYAIDSRRIERELGVVPTVDFNTGLEETVKWYVGAEGWWRPLLRDSSKEPPAST